MIVLFDCVSYTLESSGRMIELSRDFNFQIWMSCHGVIINRDAAISRDEFAVFRHH